MPFDFGKFMGNFVPGSSSRSSKKSSSSHHHDQPKKESNWREKSCPGYDSSYCGKTIKYRTDWDNIPTLCGECKQKEKNANKPQREKTQLPERERTERPQQTSDWREKTCAEPGCYNTVRYNVTWAKPPSLCSTHLEAKKAEWQEKRCQTAGCTNLVRYNVNWEHIPNFCKSFQAEFKSRRNSVPDHNPNRDAGSVSGFRSGYYNKGDNSGKIMDDSNEPDYSTHLHQHKDGTTISTFKDGEPIGRYNFDTGEDEMPKKK